MAVACDGGPVACSTWDVREPDRVVASAAGRAQGFSWRDEGGGCESRWPVGPRCPRDMGRGAPRASNGQRRWEPSWRPCSMVFDPCPGKLTYRDAFPVPARSCEQGCVFWKNELKKRARDLPCSVPWRWSEDFGEPSRAAQAFTSTTGAVGLASIPEPKPATGKGTPTPVLGQALNTSSPRGRAG